MKARPILHTFENFIHDRNEALLSLDRGKIEAYAKKYNIKLPSSDEAFWRAVHKAICSISSFTVEIRQRSEIWLYEHGSSPEIGAKMDGKENEDA